MKTLATIVLSLIAIVASLVLVLSTICAFTGGLSGSRDHSSYVACAVVSFVIVVVAMSTINRLNRKQ
jgi:hypothetical protein